MRFLLCCIVLLFPAMAQASAQQVYMDSITLAAQNNLQQAVAGLQASRDISAEEIWLQRMDLARALFVARAEQGAAEIADGPGTHAKLAHAYQQRVTMPEKQNVWLVRLLSVVLPGAGHAWMGRWADAGVVMLLVWPMLILTLWAAKRRMGPVTLFFAIITAWLWSGTVFSATSLMERGAHEAYLFWWQGLWQAAALPGRPW